MKTLKILSGLGAVAGLMALAPAARAQDSATATASGSATILTPLSLGKAADLDFGVLVRPTSGTATVSVDASGNRTVTGAAALGSASAALFLVQGLGGALYSVTVPPTFEMTSGTNTLTVSTVDNSGGGGLLTGLLTQLITNTFGVGGSFQMTTATVTGAYTGSLTVTTSYN